MQITLKNIGIIENSTIDIEGLTVIVGHNNSGKTTVGKALYSVVESVRNIDERVRYDTAQTATKAMLRALNVFSMTFKAALRMQVSFKNDVLKQFFSLGLDTVVFNQRVDEFFPELINALESFDVQDESLSNMKVFVTENQMLLQYVEKHFSQEKKAACNILKEFWNEIQNFDLRSYVLTAIDAKLAAEFCGQIQPVAYSDVESEIKISAKESLYFDLTILKNRVSRSPKTLFEKGPFDEVWFLDNPFAFDEPPYRRNHKYNANGSLLFNEERVLTHENDLKFCLHSSIKNNLEKTLNESRYKSVKEKINSVVPGTFSIDGEDNLYVDKGVKLQASNLATGSKSFAILKTLLNSGHITEETLLLLDEPEAHLHPEWQNEFAEVVVMLVKNVGCKVVLTTHSSNFMLALDAFSRKYEIKDVCNFYQAKKKENNLVEYEKKNDVLNDVYADFLDAFANAKRLYNEFVNGSV
ncbi:MAG: AAA family ATPase [Fibrobacter sp.]|nr:AAA family ATPase [Fibrobacter sp.]